VLTCKWERDTLEVQVDVIAFLCTSLSLKQRQWGQTLYCSQVYWRRISLCGCKGYWML